MRTQITSEWSKLTEREADAGVSDQLPAKFRMLRHAWFDAKIRSYPPEREWETEEEGREREEWNSENWRKYCEQTEAIIQGTGDPPLLPYCANDIWSH